MSRGGVRQRRLVLLAGDYTEGNDAELALTNCVDVWTSAGFLRDVAYVDLASGDGDEFLCMMTGSFDQISLDRALSSQAWSEVVVMSVRLNPLAKLSATRSAGEERLQRLVVRAFPTMGPVRTSFFTLSWLDGNDFEEDVLPRTYTSNLIHDSKIYVDNLLALAPFDDRSRPLSMAFTALLASGGFVGQQEMPVDKISPQDGGLHANRVVRPIRAIARAASGGWFFQRALRNSMTSDSFFVPAGILNAAPNTGAPVVLSALVDETVRCCDLQYRPLQSPHEAKKRMGFLGALVYFVKLVGRELKRAGTSVVAETVASRLEPFANALQDVYGTESIVQVRGATNVSHDSQTAADQLLQHLSQMDASGIDFRQHVEPHLWRNFAQITLGSLDGSDMPEGVTALSKGNRIVFTEPGIVGPSPVASVFSLSDRDREVLGVSKSLTFGEPDILDPESLVAFEEVLSAAKQRDLFSVNVDQAAESSAPDIRIRGIVSEAKERDRTPYEIERDFGAWKRIAEEQSSESFLGRVAIRLEHEVELARADVQFDQLRRVLEDMAASATNPKRRRRQLISVGLFGVGAVVSLIVAPLFLLWWTVGWVVANAVALVGGAVRTAIRNVRGNLQRRTESEITTMFESSRKAIQEYLRLKSMQRQFIAWSRILREVIHEPFGRIDETTFDETDLGKIPHPRQFAIAQVAPTKAQMQTLSTQIRHMVVVKGYLKSVLDGIVGTWRDEYQGLNPGGVSDPYADFRWGVRLGERLDERPICYPLQDFFNQVTNGQLRTQTAVDLQSTIESHFRGYEVRDMFGVVTDVDADHDALRAFDPSTYLFDYLDNAPAAREDFSMDLFRIDRQTAIQLRSGNVDSSSLAAWDSRQRTLGNFDLRVDQRFVMMTYLVVFGNPGTALDLQGANEAVQTRNHGPIMGPDV